MTATAAMTAMTANPAMAASGSGRRFTPDLAYNGQIAGIEPAVKNCRKWRGRCNSTHIFRGKLSCDLKWRIALIGKRSKKRRPEA